ncbi:MAG: hypothetical protein GY754_08995 [bacterium]|nr:hypothetical protein [bacterium]
MGVLDLRGWDLEKDGPVNLRGGWEFYWQQLFTGKKRNIFERTANAEKIEGTGLGLAISKRLIELQGGSMGFESKCKKGSTFWFMLPLL